MNNLHRTLSLLGLVVMTAGCASETASTSGAADTTSANPVATPNVSVQASANRAIAAPSPNAEPLPVVSVPASSPIPNTPPNLISPTTTLERLPQVRVGRSDPFAAVAANPVVVATAPRPIASPSPANRSVSTQPLSLPPLPQASQPLLPPPPPPSNSPLPSISVAPTSVGRAADNIRISGVVEVGGRLNVIVEVPGERTSRYVGVGEYLANGSVLVKRVEMGRNQEPRIILEQDGTEIVRSVGDGSSLMSRL